VRDINADMLSFEQLAPFKWVRRKRQLTDSFFDDQLLSRANIRSAIVPAHEIVFGYTRIFFRYRPK
jgi:hypothetical protein